MISRYHRSIYINCSMGQPLFKHIRQIIYNNLWRRSKGINLLFSAPAAPLASGWFVRRDWTFSSGTWYKLCSFVWNVFWYQLFPKTNQASSLEGWFFSHVPISRSFWSDCGYTFSEELYTMLVIAIYVPPI